MMTGCTLIAPLQACDIVRAADLMIGRYGRDAGARAARRVHHLERQGQRTAAVIWVRIGEAIETARRIGETPCAPDVMRDGLSLQTRTTHRQ
ncbi:hypothetical protein [Rhodospirillaceae bacterium SYSU D60014]|uniref:hypothetical protein n=1 Tax=Virgifigura deserti TaxID=2268457 RepID=UPI000E6660FA